MKERDRLIKDLFLSFATFTLFIGGMLITVMLFTQRLKTLAIKLETGKSKFEDLLFIITHGFANEILVLQKSLTGIPDRVSTQIYLRLCEMSLMIQNTVNAARLDRSKDMIISKSYDFAWQWEKLTGNFKPLSEGKGQKFLSSPAVGCMINNDEEMVYQILANLVSNAIKYAPPGGDVRLNAGVEGDTLFITISDSGPGFIPEDREVLYSKFRKLSAKPSGGERSTGLGLYIVKQLADACYIRLTLSQGSDEVCGALWELEIKTDQAGV
jgi:K+-sensing histidine kinase KdpD